MFRKIILGFVIADNFATQSFKKLFPTSWKIRGSCKQCGSCCHEIILKAHPSFLKDDWITKLIVGWIEWLFDWHMMKIDRDTNSVSFGCHNLGTDKKCGVYKWRPGVCRNYPLSDYFKEPRFLPGCGFYAEKRK